MDATIERECSALGGLFQQIITDMKVSNNKLLTLNINSEIRPRFSCPLFFVCFCTVAQFTMQAKARCRYAISSSPIFRKYYEIIKHNHKSNVILLVISIRLGINVASVPLILEVYSSKLSSYFNAAE